jgi:alkanesulfonate monooxygenase SsuD/methylene tetrahydromethanopterin reductase-like flavin-dependent oxidoreductase (luciferase family)
MDVFAMIEGQEDVNWEQWRAIAAACEGHGLAGLFRSDHYLSVERALTPEERRARGSLDAWGTICGLATLTERIRLGTLVSPATFRHPSVLAKLAATADHISGGRVELGLGAGWWEPEHRAYGFPFADTGTRVSVFAEQLEIIARSWEEGAFSFQGEHYAITDLDARPKPLQQPRPTLIVGGKAGPRSAAIAARWADEYNTVHASVEECRERRAAFAEAWERQGRDPDALRFSLMTGCVIGHDRAQVLERARRVAERRGLPERAEDLDAYLAELRQTWLVGTADEVVEQLGALAEAGVDRVMLQLHLHEDLDAIALVGAEVVPRV